MTGGGHAQAADRLNAARHVQTYPAFEPDFRQGVTGVRHQVVMHRALGGPGGTKARRRERFGDVAEAMAGVAASSDPAGLATALAMWTAAVDHAPEAAELAAWSARYLTFSECLGECLIEGRLPIAEGRLLRRRLEAIVDAHHRSPADSPLNRRPSDDVRPDVMPGDPHPDDRSIGVDDRPSRAALMLDAFCHLAALGDAHPGAMPIVDGHVPQVLIVVPAERVTGGSTRARGSETRDGKTRDGKTRGGGTAAPAPPPGAPPPGAPPPGAPPPALLWSPGAPVPISGAQARRWACGDAEIRRLVLDPEGVVTDLGRAQRIVPRDLRLRVALRDGRCRFPGCAVPAMRGQVHHLVHWAEGGGTDLRNLAVVCAHHHRFLHEGHVDVAGDPASTLVFSRHGVRIGATWPRSMLDPVRRRTG